MGKQMVRTFSGRFFNALVLVLVLTMAVPWSAFAATIQTDLWVYKSGDVVTVTGEGFQAGETVDLLTTDPEGTQVDRGTTVAGSAGEIEYKFILNVTVAGIYDVVATGLTSGETATTQFDPPNATLQGLHKGGTTWVTENLQGWNELELIPMRVFLENPDNNAYTFDVRVDFDHTKTGGGTVTPGLQDLYSFTPSSNATWVSQPVLSDTDGDEWAYSFKVSIPAGSPSNVTKGWVEFRGRMSAGAHNFGGSSLALGGQPSLKTMQIQKPAPAAGSPDLKVTKSGPASAAPGSTITYTLSYENKNTAVNNATGVQLVDTLPSGLTFVAGSCVGCTANGSEITWDLGTLAPGASGSKTFQAQVSSTAKDKDTLINRVAIRSAEDDATAGDNSASFTTTVSVANSAPTANAQTVSATEDTARLITLSGSDPDGNALTYKVTSLPANGKLYKGDSTASANEITAASLASPVSLSGTTVTYVPNADYNGTNSFKFLVNDGTFNSGEATVTINVAAVNDAPVAADDSARTDEDRAVAIDVLANDTDVENNSLSVGAGSITAPANGTATLITSGENAGKILYTPNGNFNGSDSFTYKVCDNGTSAGSSDPKCSTASATVSARVLAQNDAPVAHNDAASTSEDSARVIDVLANDNKGAANENGQTLSVKAGSITAPAHGTAELITSGDDAGKIRYTPNDDFNGNDSFTYEVCDNGISESVVNGEITSSADAKCSASAATVSLTVSAVNDAPVPADDTASTPEDTTLYIAPSTLTANDDEGAANESGQTLRISEVSNAVKGEVSIVQADDADAEGNVGKVRFVPEANYYGTGASFDYKVCDNGTPQLCSTGTAKVTVTVDPVNDAPVAVDDSASTNEDTRLDLTQADLKGNDTDVDNTNAELSVTAVSNDTNGTAVLNSDKTISFTPARDFNGTAGFDYTVSDGSLTDTGHVTVTVNAVNDKPTISSIADQETNEDVAKGPLSFTIGDVDDDLSDLDVSASSSNITLVPNDNIAISGTGANRTVTITPAANKHGEVTITLTVCDGPDSCTEEVFKLTVNSVNDAPDAISDDAEGTEDTTSYINVLSNDTDVDGDALSVSDINIDEANAAKASVSVVPAGEANAGKISFVPARDFNGTVRFSYTASDGNGGTDTASVTVRVAAINDAPSFTKGANQTVDEDAGAQTVTGWATDISKGPADESAQEVNFIVSNNNNDLFSAQPTISDNGTLSYTPAANANGSATVTVRIKDNGGTANDGADTSAEQTFTITVNAMNDAPVAVDDEATTAEDTAKTLTQADLKGNDTDVDNTNAQLSVTAVSAATNGKVVLNDDGTVTFSPAKDFNGTAGFDYTVSDGSLTDTGHVSITVTPVNDAPIADAQSVTTNEDTTKEITLEASDIDSTTLTYSIVAGPSRGTLGTISGNKVTYTPAPNYNGSDSFTFRANDGSLDSNIATVSITVTPVNDAPSADAQSVTTNEDTAKAITLTGSDVDGDSLTYSVVTGPARGTLSGTAPNLTYTPAANYNGSDSFTFRANDGSLDSNIATVSITVTPVNDAPSVSVTSFAVDSVSRMANVNATYNDVDANDTHTVVFTYKEGNEVILMTASKVASGGTVTDQSLLPARCYTNLTVTVTVTDKAGAPGSATSAATKVDVYKASFQAPIFDNERNLAKAGNVVPVKVTLTSSCAGTTVTTATLHVQVVKGIVAADVSDGEVVVTESVSSADSGTQMRTSGGGYIYNLSTKGLTTGQDYTIRIRHGDATTGAIILTAVLRTYK